MAEALGQTGITKRFAEASASLTTGWKWWLALASLLLIYFYAHYVFASITAHVTAMFMPFLIVILAAGAPPYLAVLSLAYFSNLGASLTHYGTTPAPIYFGAGYTTQRTWWWLGLITSLITIAVWSWLVSHGGKFSNSGETKDGWIFVNTLSKETWNQRRFAHRIGQRAERLSSRVRRTS